VRSDDWRRYVAPAAFLLAATLAVVLIRSGLESGGTGTATPTATARTTSTTKRVATTTTTKTTTARKPKPSGAQYWTVEAGDTFGVISSKTGVSVATIEELNPNVSSTSLFIGEKIRIK